MTSYCNICKRQLDKDEDSLSADCGGDCWGCIGEIEADSGYQPSLEQVRKEFKEGLRAEWTPAPQTHCEILGSLNRDCEIDLEIKLIRPLGEPWAAETIELSIYSEEFDSKKTEIEKSTLTTNDDGDIKYKFYYKPNSRSGEIWYQIKRKEKSWSYPMRN